VTIEPSELVDVADGVATLTLNRPDASNAFDLTMMGEVEAALERLLGANDLGRLVDAAIRPAIDDPGLLLPGRFADALQMAQASLRRSLAGRRTDGGRRERRLRQAVSVLEEQEALLALLWTYRHALYQG
jgi:hypothetical protein